MRNPAITWNLIGESIKSRFTWVALGIGILVAFGCSSLKLTVHSTSTDGQVQNFDLYTRVILFHVFSIYWVMIAAVLSGGVLLQEIHDGSISLTLPSTGDRTSYFSQRLGGMLMVLLSMMATSAGVGMAITLVVTGHASPLFVVCSIGLIPCIVFVIVVSALLSNSGMGRNTGAACFLCYLLFWFVNSGYLEKVFGPVVNSVICRLVPNVWKWQTALGMWFAGSGPSIAWVWPTVNLALYVAVGLYVSMIQFRSTDL